MKNKFPLPKLNYIAFELVKINVDDYLNSNYTAEAVETVFFATMPEQMSYSLQARDAIQQTNETVFVDKFQFAPERINYSGTFGDMPRMIAGSYMDGYSRLKQFEEDIIRKSKSGEYPLNADQFIYGLNFYDFTSGRFGAININSFTVNRNARESTVLDRYRCDFVLIGNLITVNSKDPLLSGLKNLFASGGLADQALDFMNGLLGEADPFLSYAALPFEALGTAADLVKGASGFLSGYANSSGYANLSNLF